MTRSRSQPPETLVADLGGTNLRLALMTRGSDALIQPRSFAVAAFGDFGAAIDEYLRLTGAGRPALAVVAVAGPLEDGAARLTNSGWRVSEADLRSQGFAAARLINDYEALALSLERLGSSDLHPIGSAPLNPASGNLLVIGAGTGLGVGALVREGAAAAVAATEGGHIAFAATDAVEVEILQRLQARFGRVSAERVLSGPGLHNLHQALAEISGALCDPLSPEQIVDRALDGSCALCVATLDRFCSIYGAVAGDLALAFGARGGVYLGGGIAPRIAERLAGGGFRRAFEAKGRFASYVAAIGTAIITHPFAALVGCGRARVERDPMARDPAREPSLIGSPAAKVNA